MTDKAGTLRRLRKLAGRGKKRVLSPEPDWQEVEIASPTQFSNFLEMVFWCRNNCKEQFTASLMPGTKYPTFHFESGKDAFRFSLQWQGKITC